MEGKLIDVVRTNAALRARWLGISMRTLCNVHGESAQSVSQALRGNPRLSKLVQIAAMLGVPAHALVDATFDPKAWPVPPALAELIKGNRAWPPQGGGAEDEVEDEDEDE